MKIEVDFSSYKKPDWAYRREDPRDCPIFPLDEGVYILHFESPLLVDSPMFMGDQYHYVGLAQNMKHRIQRHREGKTRRGRGRMHTSYKTQYARDHDISIMEGARIGLPALPYIENYISVHCRIYCTLCTENHSEKDRMLDIVIEKAIDGVKWTKFPVLLTGSSS